MTLSEERLREMLAELADYPGNQTTPRRTDTMREILTLALSALLSDAHTSGEVVNEEMIMRAYLRGVDWLFENGLDAEGATKAARDYADKALSTPSVGALLITTLRAERDAALKSTGDWMVEASNRQDRATTAEALVQSMREALEPFDRAARALSTRSYKRADVVVALPVDHNHPNQLRLTAGNFFDVRAALSRSEV